VTAAVRAFTRSHLLCLSLRPAVSLSQYHCLLCHPITAVRCNAQPAIDFPCIVHDSWHVLCCKRGNRGRRR